MPTSARKNQYGQPIGPAVENWSERSRPPRTTMTGQYCRLEPVNPRNHAAQLFAAFMQAPDERDWTYLFADRPQTPALLDAYLHRLARSEDPLHYAIVDAHSGNAVGTAAFMRIDPGHGAIEVGSITYAPCLKRTPAGTEAMYLMMRRVFDELHYRRYEWKCDSLNAASCAAARRYGFTFEGIFRQAIVYKGRSRDTAWFSITQTEWPRVRIALQGWLDPRNFDAAGCQRRTLASIRESIPG